MVWWEIVFMMVVLKIPVVYLCAVVWWAIKAEPLPGEGTAAAGGDEEPDGPRPWWLPPRRRRTPGPHGAPVRRSRRAARHAFARGKVER
jgi:hypothetical protein